MKKMFIVMLAFLFVFVSTVSAAKYVVEIVDGKFVVKSPSGKVVGELAGGNITVNNTGYDVVINEKGDVVVVKGKEVIGKVVPVNSTIMTTASAVSSTTAPVPATITAVAVTNTAKENKNIVKEILLGDLNPSKDFRKDVFMQVSAGIHNVSLSSFASNGITISEDSENNFVDVAIQANINSKFSLLFVGDTGVSIQKIDIMNSPVGQATIQDLKAIAKFYPISEGLSSVYPYLGFGIDWTIIGGQGYGFGGTPLTISGGGLRPIYVFGAEVPVSSRYFLDFWASYCWRKVSVDVLEFGKYSTSTTWKYGVRFGIYF